MGCVVPSRSAALGKNKCRFPDPGTDERIKALHRGEERRIREALRPVFRRKSRNGPPAPDLERLLTR